MTSTHPNPRPIYWLLMAGLAALIANGVVAAYLLYFSNAAPTVQIEDLTIPEEAILCPGDTLSYEFSIVTSRAATVDVKTSFRPDGDLRPSYERLQEFIFTEPVSFRLVRHYVIPAHYANPATGLDEPWIPGRYWQRTVVTVAGQSSGADVIEVPFAIRDNC